MKIRLMWVVLSCLVSLTAASQTKVSKFCEVDFGDFKKVIFGTDSSRMLKDQSELKTIQLVKKCKTGPQILEFMNKYGWTVVSVTYVPDNKMVYYFKKDFDSSDYLDSK